VLLALAGVLGCSRLAACLARRQLRSCGGCAAAAAPAPGGLDHDARCGQSLAVLVRTANRSLL
jgi:hypothetical protein